MEVLLLDEISMIDRDCFTSIKKVLSEVNADKQKDEFGTAHMLLFGGFKQLPPASSVAPFIVIPAIAEKFEFRCLRENRRVVQERNRGGGRG